MPENSSCVFPAAVLCQMPVWIIIKNWKLYSSIPIFTGKYLVSSQKQYGIFNIVYHMEETDSLLFPSEIIRENQIN